MTTEQKLSAIVVDTVAKLGIRCGHDGLLDAMKDAVVKIHIVMREERECDKQCYFCNRPDCPVNLYQNCYQEAV